MINSLKKQQMIINYYIKAFKITAKAVILFPKLILHMLN